MTAFGILALVCAQTVYATTVEYEWVELDFVPIAPTRSLHTDIGSIALLRILVTPDAEGILAAGFSIDFDPRVAAVGSYEACPDGCGTLAPGGDPTLDPVLGRLGSFQAIGVAVPWTEPFVLGLVEILIQGPGGIPDLRFSDPATDGIVDASSNVIPGDAFFTGPGTSVLAPPFEEEIAASDGGTLQQVVNPPTLQIRQTPEVAILLTAAEEWRGVVEFDLFSGSFPTSDARLFLPGGSTVSDTEVFFYTGDGVLDTSDFFREDLEVLNLTRAPGPGTLWDVSDVVNSFAAQGDRYLGVLFASAGGADSFGNAGESIASTDSGPVLLLGQVVFPSSLRADPNKQALTWSAPEEPFDEFTVYRGAVAELTDSDDDGLPDTGYGACQNSRDSDTTDLVFEDSDIPAPRNAFFYVIGFVSSGIEDGLGSTSDEIPRFVTIACPP